MPPRNVTLNESVRQTPSKVGLLPDAGSKSGFTALLKKLPANGGGFVKMLRTPFKEMNEGRPQFRFFQCEPELVRVVQ